MRGVLRGRRERGQLERPTREQSSYLHRASGARRFDAEVNVSAIVVAWERLRLQNQNLMGQRMNRVEMTDDIYPSRCEYAGRQVGIFGLRPTTTVLRVSVLMTFRHRATPIGPFLNVSVRREAFRENESPFRKVGQFWRSVV